MVYQAVSSGDLEIDSEGRVWRVRKRGWDRWKGAVVSRPCRRVRAENDNGTYLQVGVMFCLKEYSTGAHRLVYRHFKGPIPDGLTINHKDGKKKRNHPDNLELASYSEQQIHATQVLKVGHACNQSGENNSMARLTTAQVEEIRRRRLAGEKLRLIAADYGVKFQHVSKIARGDRRCRS